MQLKSGMDPNQVVKQLGDKINEANGLSVSLVDDTNMIHRYVGWVSAMQQILLWYFLSPELDRLYTTRYWQLYGLMHATGSRRIPESIRDEVLVQIEWISALVRDLEERIQRFGSDSSTTLAVIDTNVLVHAHQTLRDTQWSDYVPATRRLRLLVPIRVIEELDELKFRGATRDKARAAVRQLVHLIDRPNEPTDLSEFVTIESYVPTGFRPEIASGDTEILRTCDEIKTYSGHDVTVITRDFGMSLRIRNAGFDAFLIED